MVRRLALLALLPAFAVVAFVVALLLFYRGGYDPPSQVEIPYKQLTAPHLSPGDFVDTPAVQLKRGLVVVDAMHSNAFTEAELFNLGSRVANRGYDVEFAGGFTAVPRGAPRTASGGGAAARRQPGGHPAGVGVLRSGGGRGRTVREQGREAPAGLRSGPPAADQHAGHDGSEWSSGRTTSTTCPSTT